MLPAARKALRLRFGEQNLHRNSAPLPASGRLSGGAICSPLPAKPCGSVLGSKIFTESPRRSLQAAGFPAARFAPRRSQSLAAPFRGAKSSQKFRAASCKRPAFRRRDLLPAARKALRLRFGEQNLHRNSAPPPACRPMMLAPPRRQPLMPPPGHANRAPQNPPAGRSCWRRPAGNPLCHRRGTPTGRPKTRLPADHVGAAPPATPYATVGPRQQGAPKPACRLIMLAPPHRQPLMPPPGHANRAPQNPLAGQSCWRRPAGKPLCHRRATPTVRPEFRLPADHVGAAPPATPYATAGPRQQGAPKPACRPIMLAPPRLQPLMPPSGHANRAPQNPPADRSCWRRPTGNPLCHRRGTPTGRPICESREKDCRHLSPAKHSISIGSLKGFN